MKRVQLLSHSICGLRIQWIHESTGLLVSAAVSQLIDENEAKGSEKVFSAGASRASFRLTGLVLILNLGQIAGKT